MNESIHRLFDANINRAVEGIRVLEEAARMVLDDAELTGCIKDIRHTLIQVVKSEKNLSRSLLPSRGSEHDVLRNGETAHERRRGDLLSVIEANAGRAQEALRVLEEYGKLVYPSLSGRFKALRFSLYDIEKKLTIQLSLQHLLSRERLCFIAIIDLTVLTHRNSRAGDDPGEWAKACVDEGTGTIAFGDSVSPDNEFLMHAERVLGAAEGGDVTTLICDRLDCALIVGADGILLGPSGLPVDSCKRVAGQDFIIGYTERFENNTEETVHSTSLQEPRKDAHFIVIELPGLGMFKGGRLPDGFSEYVKASPIPVIAQGDFSVAEIEIVLNSGFTGIAVKPNLYPLPSLAKLAKVVRAYDSGNT